MRRPAALIGPLLLGGVTLAGCAAGTVAGLPAPPTTEVAPVTTTIPEPPSIPLVGIDGTTSTTSIQVAPGTSTLQGTVTGPSGPVPGAIVRLERVSNSGAAAYLDTSTRQDGTFAAPGVRGGAYRVRAWRAPDLGMSQPVTLFVGSGQTSTVELGLQQYTGTQVSAALAPNPAVVGNAAQLVVQITKRAVAGADGTVTTQPQTGVSVELQGSGDWSVTGSNPSVTDGAGQVTWEVECQNASAGGLAVLVGATSYPLTAVTGCVTASP